MLHNESHTKRPEDEARPQRCPKCGQLDIVEVTLEYPAEVRHDGRVHKFLIPDLRISCCQACGEKVFTEDVDQQINTALRGHLGLLMPSQIAESIEALGITQKEFAQRVGIAEATLSRWLTETQIQSRPLDNLLRLFFEFPDVRAALPGGSQDPQLGAFCVPSERQDQRRTRHAAAGNA